MSIENEVPRKLHVTVPELEAWIEQARLHEALARRSGHMRAARQERAFVDRMTHHLHRAKWIEIQTRQSPAD